MLLRKYMVFVMKRVFFFVTSQQLLVPIVFAGLFAVYQWYTGSLHFDSLEAACRSLWPYVLAVGLFGVVIGWQAGGDLNRLLREEQSKLPTLFLPTLQPNLHKKIIWPGPAMAVLFSFLILAPMVLITYAGLLWVEPWKVSQLLVPPPDLTYPPPPSRPVLSSPSTPRSYLEFEGNPVFTGTSPTGTEGAAFSVGDPLGFNEHYRITGPNSVKLLLVAFETEVVTGVFKSRDGSSFDQAPIDDAVDEFFAELKKEIGAHKGPIPSHTMMPTDREYRTAFAFTDDHTQHRIVSQGDLAAIKDGSETFVVIGIMTYSDQNKIHNLRKCMWLLPPATPESVWHFCGGKFPDSD